MVATYIGAVAAGLAIATAAFKAVGWPFGRRKRLEVRLTLSSGPPLGPGGENPKFATVHVRNAGRRPVVLVEIGITRCELRRFRKPRLRTARSNIFRNGDRLGPDDVREAGFEIAKLPPDHDGMDLPLWGYARVSGKDEMYMTRKPLEAMDRRRGSPTTGQRIFP